MDTIFALSSGGPPAAIGLIRISGPAAGAALRAVAGRVPVARRALLASLRDADGLMLDQAMVLWLPGPHSATGEDLAELHCHGGRAVIAAVEHALAALPGLRRADPGEFTRRAFANGRIDLAEAEGLADLLSAETELQRRSAIALAGGALSRAVEHWRARVLALSAQVELQLDFADEGDVAPAPDAVAHGLAALAVELTQWLDRPRAEPLREGIRVVIAGPPNAGKSTLFNRLTDSEAAIVTPIAGTTRDVLERAVALNGVAFVFCDTAGLREAAADPVEAIGIARARASAQAADIVLWLGEEGAGPGDAWEIEAQIDLDRPGKRLPAHRVSASNGAGIAALVKALIAAARRMLPAPGEVALNHRQGLLIAQARDALAAAGAIANPLLVAEHCRMARAAFDALTGRAATEDLLDSLFARFCIGK